MAFFQSNPPSRERFLNAPASVLWLIGAIMAAHALRVALPAQISEDIILRFAFIPARYSPEALAVYGWPPESIFDQAVPFVGYLFLHGNFGHAAINSLWLLAFGPSVAHRLGTLRFLLFYLVCGFAAAAAHLFSAWGSFVPVVGASGAVSGLMAAGIRILYGSRMHVFREQSPLAPIFSRPVLLFSGIWIVVNIVAGRLGLGVTAESQLIAWVAHLGGYFAGLLGIGLFEKRRVTGLAG